MENKFVEFSELVYMYIKFNRRNRPHWKRHIIGYNFYIREYCTVLVNAGRQVGKTQYIVDNASINDAIIVGKISMANCIKDRILRKYDYKDFKNMPFKPPLPDVFTINFLKLNYFDKTIKGIENIYIDEPSMNIFKIYMDFIYKLFEDNEIDQTFIILGGY